MASSGIYHATC